jgi:predicted phage terminase large subunit-like protein
MSLAASLQQPSAWDQATTRLLELLEPEPPPLELPDVGIAPQPGPQEQLVNSRADLTIAGGAAGVGKTFGLLLNPLKHKENPGFGAVIFRRETTQVKAEGGIWDESEKLYPLFAASPNLTTLKWGFPSGMSVQFAHMQHAKDRFAWDGSQIPCIGFDQLESFEEIQFWYMFSRNRSVCGVKPYVIATCNPVPADDPVGGWLNRFIAWWIDQDTGLFIPARAGKTRWFVRINEQIHWADTPDALRKRFPDLGEDVQPKSVVFIPGTLDDNKILQQKDPSYRANLLALPFVERERLLGGNWKVRASAGKVFNRAWFRIVDASPRRATRVRYWDKAGTEGGGKRTAGVRLAWADDGLIYIEDVSTGQWKSGSREKVIRQTAELDGLGVTVWVEQEPGSGGKESAENTIANLAGYTIRADKVTGDKITRAGPLAAQAEVGNVVLVRGAWNELFLSEAQAYEKEAPFKDQIDAAAGAFNKLAAGRKPVLGAVKAGDRPGAVDPRVEAAEGRRRVREQQSDEFRALERLVAQHGSLAVEAIKRLADPTFTLPEELRGR